MKNKFIQYYTIGFYLCATCVLFAQPGTGTTTVDDLNTPDEQPVPIDSYLWVLMGLGLIFAFYVFRAKSIQNKTNSVS